MNARHGAPHPSTVTRRCSASAVACVVMHHGDADIVAPGLMPSGVGAARHIRPAKRASPASRHSRSARLHAAALRRDIEPQEEAAGRALVAVAVADDLVGEIEFLRIEPCGFRSHASSSS